MDQYFTHNANTFQTEASKVNYTAALLEDEHGIAWSHGPPISATTSWQGFQQWRLDRLEDLRYRPWTTSVRFFRLKQQQSQTAREFLNEFELRRAEFSIESKPSPDIPIWSRIFFSMLREDVRSQLYKCGEIPTDLLQLTSKATVVEQNPERSVKSRLKDFKKKKRFHSATDKQKRESSKSNSSKPQTESKPRKFMSHKEKNQFKKEGRCFNCKEIGHISSQCSEKTSETTFAR